MYKKIFCLFLILKVSEARYGFVPKFYGQDSAVIVDTDKPLPPTNKLSLNYPTKLRLPPPFPMWQHFPRYHIIPPPPGGQILSINTWPKNKLSPAIAQTSTTSSTTTTTSTTTTSTTTTTPKPIITSTTPTAKPINTNSKFRIDTVPFVTDDEFPRELLNIAQTKLGLKSLDEIPSISELGQLLGTNSPQETLNYIKQLTANEQGVALMKAYIESTDYTDNAGDLDNNKADDDEEIDDLGDIEEPLKINDEGLVVITDENSNDDYIESENDNQEDVDEEIEVENFTLKPRKTPKIINQLKDLSDSKPSLMERIATFMHLNNMWHKKTSNKAVAKKQGPVETESLNKNSDLNELYRLTEQGKKVETKPNNVSPTTPNESELKQDVPILVREPIPYNYPVPLRPQVSSTTSTTAMPTVSSTTSSDDSTSVVHLNTPKLLIPHVQQLARVTKIHPKKIEDFLASKPKLLELANKVSRFPIGYDRNSPLEAQVMSAVQRAIEQDDDLKKLLSSTTTLK